MKHVLHPLDYALKVPRQALDVSQLPGLVGECRRRAGDAGLETPLSQWLAVRGPQTAVLLDILEELAFDAGRRMHPVHDAGNIVHLSFLKMQLGLLRQYLARGWRVGLCAPWQITDSSGLRSFRVHAARVLRSDTEPYLLRQDRPICLAHVPSPGGYVTGEVNCQRCTACLEGDPQHYPLAVPVS